MLLKLFSLAILGTALFFGNMNDAKKPDLEAYRVTENRPSMNGIYYSYEIKNIGEKVVSGGSY